MFPEVVLEAGHTIPFEVKTISMERIQTIKKDGGAVSAGVLMIVLAKMRSVDELGLNVKEVETNTYAHVYNRLCIASGLKYDTGVKGEVGKTYTLSFDLRNRYPDEDFRLNIAGSDSSNAYGFELTNGGIPYSDKWETYRFTFKVKDAGNIIALIHGGYNRIGIYATMSDFDFDNVYLIDDDDKTKTNLITGTMEPVTFDDNIDGCMPLTITPETQDSTVISETEVIGFESSDTVN